jgi:hypothetical protein
MKFSHSKKRGKKKKREREGLHSMKGKGFHLTWEMNFMITLVNMPKKELWYQMDLGIIENNNNNG